jgi:ABC-type glycerol-3-phosphate transport system permease component
LKTGNSFKAMCYILLIIGVIISFIPFYWMILSSARPESEIFSRGLNLFPNIKNLSLINYIELFKTTGMLRWLRNSIIVAVLTTAIAVILSAMGGFAFAKYNFFGRNLLFFLVLGSATIPQFVTIIPVFALMSKLNLVNTHWSLILPFSVNAFAVFLMRQYIVDIPYELIDSARIDGCSEMRIFFNIIIPLSKPALGAAAIFIFQNVWNQYLWPLVMMQSDTMFTLPVGLASLTTLYTIKHGMLSAGSFISTLPMIIIFLALQKQFVAGLTAGAIKG